MGDFVVATNRSRWGMPEINWDITPGWGGTAKIAKFAGRRKAKEWNLIGRQLSRETLRMFALNPKPCLKLRFVFDSVSIGLGISAPDTLSLERR